jgi:hypothetical protein
MLILCEWEQKSSAEVQVAMEWDDNKYKAVRKRKLRMIARWKVDGRVQ